jgi:hypothetical protein
MIPAIIDIRWRYIIQRFMVPLIVVVIDEDADLLFQFCW